MARPSSLLVAALLVVLLPSASSTEAVAARQRTNDPLVDEMLANTDLPPQTMLYYNARIALREGRHQDVLRLWLMRNALEYQGESPEHDDDFRSALWVALSGAGLCHDGIPADDNIGGAGLWPLAMHNWLVRSTSKQPAPPQPRSFTSFDSGFQQRHFSLYDILSYEELRGARFMRGNCWRPYFSLLWLGTPHWLDLKDRLSVGIMMRDLIDRSRRTLDTERVRGQVVLETRLFDIDVALGKLAKSAARRETGVLAQVAKTTGVSETAMMMMREERLAEVRKSKYTALLRRSLRWHAEDWFSLSQNRRLALFGEAAETYADTPFVEEDLRRTLLQNIDALLDNKSGEELEQWLGFASQRSFSRQNTTPGDSARREALIKSIVLDVRGEKILGVDVASGFRERSSVALWRGVDHLERGERLDSMRSFALAMQTSDDSRQADEVHRLAKRWFAYVLAQHRADDEALAILEQFVSPLDRNDLLEILLWRAAFYADEVSFARIAAGIRRGGALDLRKRHLELLATGDAGAMWTQVREDYESPHAVYKFAHQLTDELATENLDVRVKNRRTLELGKVLLAEVSEEANRGLRRRIDDLMQRMQVLLDAIEVYDTSPDGRARSAAPGAVAYAGSVRLAPADPLPWPFAFPSVQPPSPFSPLELRPIEWLDAQGERVFGWQIRERQ
jgi:hypothetical protein